jgi:hypothetical protein
MSFLNNAAIRASSSQNATASSLPLNCSNTPEITSELPLILHPSLPILKENFVNTVCLKYTTEEQYGHTPCRLLFNYPVLFPKPVSISRFPDSLMICPIRGDVVL